MKATVLPILLGLALLLASEPATNSLAADAPAGAIAAPTPAANALAAVSPAAGPPEIKLANSAPEVPFGMSIVLDTTPSAHVHRIAWSVHPEKYEGSLIDLGQGRTLFTCNLPGRYVFYGAASNTAGDLVKYRYSVRILPPGEEMIEEMRRQAEEVGSGGESDRGSQDGDDRASVRTAAPRRPAPRAQLPGLPHQQIGKASQDDWGLRGDVEAIVQQMVNGTSGSDPSFNWSAESKRIAAAYDAAGGDILARQHTGEMAQGAIRQRLDGIDEAIRKKWLNATDQVKKRLDELYADGKLPTYDRWHIACQVVSGALGEVR